MMRLLAILAVAALGSIASACGTDADVPPTEGSADAGSDVMTSIEVAAAPPRPEHTTYVVSRMSFTFDEPEGTAPGFDLDGVVSNGTDGSGCNVEDQTGPDGTPGIDNQLARFMPFIEAAGINQLPDYLQGAILEGGISMVAVVEGVDDFDNDDDVRVIILRGTGRPLVDLDNNVEPWQTVGLDEEDSVLGVSTSASIKDGMLVGNFDQLRMPALLFDVFVDLHLTFGRFSFPVGGDLERSGYGSGAVTLAEIIEIIEKTPSGNLGDVISNLGPSLADIDHNDNGECDALSAVLEIGVVPAYLQDSHMDLVQTLTTP